MSGFSEALRGGLTFHVTQTVSLLIVVKQTVSLLIGVKQTVSLLIGVGKFQLE